MSNRQKKQIIREGVQRLKNTPGWDPKAHVREAPQEQLREMSQKGLNQRTYESASQCPQCQAAQSASGDDSALCESHLREAMGF